MQWISFSNNLEVKDLEINRKKTCKNKFTS